MVQTYLPSDIVQRLRDVERGIAELRKRTGLSQGRGLDTPYLTYGPIAVNNIENVSLQPGATSFPFQSIQFTRVGLTHPRIQVFWTVGTDNSATGEGRMMLDGIQVGPTVTVTGDLNGVYDVPGWGIDRFYNTTARIDFEVSKTGGTGRVIGTLSMLRGVGFRAT